MLEKFDDYESEKYVSEEGTFLFKVESCEMKIAKSGSDMAVFVVRSDKAGMTTIYHSLDPKARWSYNKLIKACLNLSPEKAKTFELDYSTIGQSLVGTAFVGIVKAEPYTRDVKVENDDGTFTTCQETITRYKIKEYEGLLEHPEFVF